MKVNTVWLGVTAILLEVAFLLGMYQWAGLTGIMVGLVFTAVLLGVGIAYGQSRVRISEMAVGVVFRRDGNFSRFLDSGYRTINPFTERLESTISKGSHKATGNCQWIRTAEGIPVSMEWSVSFKLDPFSLSDSSKPSLARSLPEGATKMVSGKATHAIRHLIEQKSLNDLFAKGALRALEAELAQDLWQRSKGIGVKEIPANDVQIGPITLPEHVERTLTAVQERNLRTNTNNSWVMRVEKPN